MTGFVYFIRRGEFGSIKVGYSVDVKKRLIGLQTASDLPLCLLGFTRANLAQEAEAHAVLAPYRKSGEWFENQPFVLEFLAAAVAFGIDEAIVLGREHVRPFEWKYGGRPKARYRGGSKDHTRKMQEAIDSI